MSTLEIAIKIANNAHAGITDKQGLPYILHPLRVMHDVTSQLSKIVAVLHDVVEDTSVTFTDLVSHGFNEDVITPLKLLTHRRGQSYVDYIVALSENHVAHEVKMADLRDNTNLNRILLHPDSLEKDLARIKRYLLSYKFLQGNLSEAQYRDVMKRDVPKGWFDPR